MAAGEVVGWIGDAVPSSGTPSASIQRMCVGSLSRIKSFALLLFLRRQSQWERRRQNSQAMTACIHSYVPKEVRRLCFVRLKVSQFHRSEPVGSKAPAFQSEAKSVTYVKHAKSSVALTCSAQASPPPNYR
ncbi:Down syndrome cell adhesion molecule-like protein Dscam2 isoform X46 [Vespula maculifrons]|uniref:Down syndrome cell adhesion molecule-like protein Dscam2 isoform X46 n=1 Tax=Vespula maculifrons TaxID=7453 RepID=A0ABD2C974_VESMC